MKNFAKSVLNYFAAFNETRFRFSRKLPYEWTDDPYTLDLSVFPVFQKQLLDSITQGTPITIEVRKGDHTVSLDSEEVKEKLNPAIDLNLNAEFLKTVIENKRTQIAEAFPGLDPLSFRPEVFPKG